MSPWILLAVAIVTEVAATLSLRLSHGFTRPLPSLVVVSGYLVATFLLARIVRELPIGLTYAVWAGSGTALTAVIAIVALGETVTTLKVASIALIIVGVVGLNVESSH